jgi:hypothetical protein
MKRLLLALMVVAVIALIASADPLHSAWLGPTYPWGTDASNWTGYGDAWTSGELLYNSTLGDYTADLGAHAFVWPNLQIDYFLELETVVNFDWHQVQVHRVSVYDPIVLSLGGSVHSNSANDFSMQTTPVGDIDYLKQLSSMGGGSGTNHIPLTWQVIIDALPIASMGMINGGRGFEIPACDHTFAMIITLTPAYHQTAGHYGLTAYMCPEPGL